MWRDTKVPRHRGVAGEQLLVRASWRGEAGESRSAGLIRKEVGEGTCPRYWGARGRGSHDCPRREKGKAGSQMVELEDWNLRPLLGPSLQGHPPTPSLCLF